MDPAYSELFFGAFFDHSLQCNRQHFFITTIRSNWPWLGNSLILLQAMQNTVLAILTSENPLGVIWSAQPRREAASGLLLQMILGLENVKRT